MSSLLGISTPSAVAQTTKVPPLTDAEAREAQQLSTTFTKRLGETLDFGVVMNELFLPDAVERFVANEKRKAKEKKSPYVLVWPGMFVDTSALETASVDDWRRLYVATANFILLGFVREVRSGDLDKTSLEAFYPVPVVELVNRNALLRNFIQKKDVIRPLKSAGEMRSAATTLEQANAILRRDVPTTPDLEELVLQFGARAAAKTAHLTQQQIEERLQQARSEMVKLEIFDEEMLGFPKGTRLIVAMTFTAHGLILVRVDQALRIAWVFPFTG
jgi:hypothetical protein